VTAAGLARLGHEVRLGEADAARLALLENGEVPIFEDGLAELIDEARQSRRLSFHGSNGEAASGAAMVFLCLPTPPGARGRADLSFIETVIDELALKVDPRTIFVVKSTVPPGTVVGLRKRLANLGSAAAVVSHPEFLREGSAVSDFLDPDRIVVGAFEAEDAVLVASLYRELATQVVSTDPTSAEMIKYASNSYLATRLTFANTLANLCEAAGADILDVLTGVGLDHRIGPHFLQPGPGYGGSCFPKDTLALIGVAEDAGYDFKQVDPDWFDVIRPVKLPARQNQFGADGNTYFSVRQTRFGVKSEVPTSAGALKTQFEFELFGTGSDAGQTTFRLRHAYGELGQFGAGQTWSPFMDIDVFPNSVEYWGPNGMVFFRNVQFRWMPVQGESRVTLALERPGASADQGVYAGRIELQDVRPHFPMPDISGEARLGRSWGYVEAAGMVRRIKWVDNGTDALNLSGSVWGWGLNFRGDLEA